MGWGIAGEGVLCDDSLGWDGEAGENRKQGTAKGKAKETGLPKWEECCKGSKPRGSKKAKETGNTMWIGKGNGV
jgi:hypothetical protein